MAGYAIDPSRSRLARDLDPRCGQEHPAIRGCSPKNFSSERLVNGQIRFETIEEMQTVLDQYFVDHNTKRPHQGRGMNGRTPIAAFIDGIGKDNTPKPNPIRKAA
jgi:hypothetical protein